MSHACVYVYRSDKYRHDDEETSSENERKQRRRLEKESEKVAKVLGYSNEINPFGDSNLLQPFIWGKKEIKLKKEGKHSSSTISIEDKSNQLMADIERARKRREDKAQAMEEMERLRTEEQRLRESSSYGDWERKEEEFHSTQTQVGKAHTYCS
jgi:monoamine oxidase